jgi:hypothetical protein
VLFAGGGLFFNEWYWEPIFRAIVALPFLGIVAFVTALVSRRWIPDLGHRVWVAVAIIVGGEALILGGGLHLASGQDARDCTAGGRPRPRRRRRARGTRGVARAACSSPRQPVPRAPHPGERITEPEVLAHLDALRPVEPDDLEFNRG